MRLKFYCKYIEWFLNMLVLRFSFYSLLLYVLSYMSNAQATESNVLNFRTIDVSPYGIRSDKHCGVYFDLANKLTVLGGITATNVITPYPRIIHELKTGKSDLSILFRYQELEGFVEFIAPLPPLEIVLMGLKGATLNSLKDLENKRLGYLRGAKLSEKIDANPNILKYDINNFDQGVNMMKLGRLDAIIGPKVALYSSGIKYDLGIEDFSTPYVISVRTPWLQLSRKTQRTVAIQNFIKKIKQVDLKEEVLALYEQYRLDKYKCM